MTGTEAQRGQRRDEDRDVTGAGLLLQDVRIDGEGARQDVEIRSGRIAARRDHTPAAATPRELSVLEGGGRLLLPGLVNAHAHIDKSWWGLPWQSYGGDGGTEGRIRHERERRDELGIPGQDITRRVLREMLRHGTTAIRSHVDVDLGVGLRGLEIVREAVSLEAPDMALSLVAFPQDGVLRRPGVDALLRQAVREGAEHVGGLDPAGIDRDPAAQLRLLVDIAEETGCGIDVHLHDPGELGAFQIDLLLDMLDSAGLHGRANLAHGFAISDVPASRAREIAQRAASLGVTWTTVAPVGRTPLPRRILAEAGVAVGLGTDGIRDLWSPYGDGDLLRIAQQHARMTGAACDEDLHAVLRSASIGARGFVGQEVPDGDGLAVGDIADLILVEAENPMDALVRAPRPRVTIRAGRVLDLAEAEPWR